MMNEKELRDLARNYPCNSLFGVINVDNVPFDKIERQLKEDEVVKVAFVANAGSVGRVNLQRLSLAVTNKRILIQGKLNSLLSAIIEGDVLSIKLDNVNTIGSTGLTLNIRTIGDEDICVGNYKAEAKQKLVADIEKAIEEFNTNKQTTSSQTIIQQKTSAQELKEFKELLDAGIISQEEFDAKKKQLLGL